MKDVTADMREIYTSVNREQAVSALSHFEQNGVQSIDMRYRVGIVIRTI